LWNLKYSGNFAGDCFDIIATSLDAKSRIPVERQACVMELLKLLQAAAKRAVDLLLVAAPEEFFHRAIQEDRSHIFTLQQGGVIRLNESASAQRYHSRR